MSGRAEELPTVDRRGRIALLDLVEHSNPEASSAFAGEMERALAQAGGRVAWAGRIDQQLIGAGSERFDEIWISEFSTREACARALANRAAPHAARVALV